MRLAKGCTRHPSGKVEYPARFDPDVFHLVASYAKANNLSFNRALIALVSHALDAERRRQQRRARRHPPPLDAQSPG